MHLPVSRYFRVLVVGEEHRPVAEIIERDLRYATSVVPSDEAVDAIRGAADVGAIVGGDVDFVPMSEVEGRIAATLALIYPPGIGIIVPGERWDDRAQPMLDYFLAFEDSANRFPDVSNEMQGVYAVPEGDSVRFHAYVVRER